MFNLETGKIKLKPNEIKTVSFKKGKFKKKPVVNITAKGNYNYFLVSVNKRMFIVENNTNENIVLHYTASETNNTISVTTPVVLTILTTDYSILFETGSPDVGTIDVNLDDYTTPPQGETVTYSLVDDGSITDLAFYVSINNNTLTLVDNQMLFLAHDPLVFDVLVTLDSDPNITATITMTFDPATQIYSADSEDGITLTTNSLLTPFRQYHITYNASSGESSSVFILPELSQNASENYIKITANITSSPSMQLNISNELEIYLTSNPEDPTNNRTIQENSLFPNNDYGLNLEDTNSYYFWHDENDNVWYVSTERFPLS
jgi:hypothetical protein